LTPAPADLARAGLRLDLDQPAPGPADRVPDDWQEHLH